MEYYNELRHAGVKGMKWGQRLYQNKDGSLTPLGRLRYSSKKRKAAKAKAKAAKERAKAKAAEELLEAKKKELLKSTNAEELYKNRHLFTTQELNERLNRIDTERRLGEAAARNKKSAMDTVDKVLKTGRKVNEVYEFTNTPVMKALKKKISGDSESYTPDLKKALGKLDKLSDEELQKIIKRTNNEKLLKKLVSELGNDS